ncbi:uncharacterized protein J4E87_010790 [Alternaria ethzedia]|uniref:uncharacterized protein n=1 Tax=Alternaria ethzedia TaxID=181014 RepID=UPI0020C38594|nr:uncharacterized protein J4E87_010790 [Alternaria ethzedia]KAI4610536.1 hypothetical protein J4E87_010790 [Alternaria ethzedia]
MATFSDPSTYLNFLISPRIPPELVLKTIQHLPFNDGSLITTIRSAHPRLRAIFKNYERSITGSFMKKELRHAETDFKCGDGRLNVDWLADCVHNYDIVDDVMDALCSEHNFNAVLQHNVPLANAGLLLLYRLVSIEDHADRLTYIKSLPRDPLVAIYLVLHHATLSARYHGSGWINQRTYGRFMDANHVELRSELEFCFAEAALCLGPEFISDTLLHHDTSNAETILLNFYHDHGTHDWDWPCWGTAKGEFEPPRTQGPQREEGSGRSLFTTMLERLAECMGCELGDVRPRVERQLESAEHELAYLSLAGKARLLEGRDVEDVDGR